MRALVTGAHGQVGRALAQSCPSQVTLVALGRAQLDITDAAAVTARIEAERPALIINAAAYTAVDRAEDDPESAMRINRDGVAHLAAAAESVGAQLVHLSSDFIFDGARTAPYAADAAPNPISVYGATKLAGERAAGPDALIVRTSWVHSATRPNFVRTMLNHMGKGAELRVVHDQIGSPSHAAGLAAAIWALALAGARGVHHYTDGGTASWYDFAVAIQQEALAFNLLDRPVPIAAIPTTAFPTRAARPAYSVLDKETTWAVLGQPAPHWREGLRHTLKDIRDHG